MNGILGMDKSEVQAALVLTAEGFGNLRCWRTDWLLMATWKKTVLCTFHSPADQGAIYCCRWSKSLH